MYDNTYLKCNHAIMFVLKLYLLKCAYTIQECVKIVFTQECLYYTISMLLSI